MVRVPGQGTGMVSSRIPFSALTLCFMGIRRSRVALAFQVNGHIPGSAGAERANGRLTESGLRQALVAAFRVIKYHALLGRVTNPSPSACRP